MTFAVLMIKGERPQVVGTLWANDEAGAQLIAPAFCECADGEHLRLRRTEDREIPLRLPERTVWLS